MASAPLQHRSNRRVGIYAASLALFMLALGWASIPLYRMFCQATGWAGTTQRATEAKAAAVKAVAQTITVRFDGNVDRGMPWQFGPEQISQTIRLGTRSLAIFKAKNLSDHPITGRASFNVQPDETGKYFTKIQCFCFTEQTLAPGQEVRMPVIYYVDPSILQDEDARDNKLITLSYTFHEVPKGSASSSAKPLDPTATAR
jgi:cytochrome c oxidase assembly protein subunit 11